MKSKLLYYITAAVYAVLLLWEISGGVTGNELLFSLAGLYVFPCAAGFAAGVKLRSDRRSVLLIAGVLAMQILLPLFVFRNFKPQPLILAVAFSAAGVFVGKAVGSIRRR